MQANIIQLLKTQDSAAIAQLYDAYGGALYFIVLRIVSSKELAQQVTQDTFLKAWHHGANYDESKGRLFTWLLNIARNTAIDATRTAHFNHSRKTESIECLNHTSGGEALNLDTIGLREVVYKMEDKYKILIELVYFNGYTQEKVAEEIGVPLGTVKSRLRCAISELRKTYEL